MSLISLVRNAANQSNTLSSPEYCWHRHFDWVLWNFENATVFAASKVPTRMDEIWTQL